MTAPLRFGRAEVRPSERQLLVDGRAVALGARAFDVLLTLLERRERVVSKSELLDSVWPGLVVEENNLQVHISTLRKLLGPQTISTIPGRGYRFTAKLESGADHVADREVTAAAPDPTPASLLPKSAPGNLAPHLRRLIGRDDDRRMLLSLIETHPLVTLVGAAGVGKTTLAMAAAHALRDRWSDGTWMVELARVTDPAQLPHAVAQALRIALGGAGSAQDQLVGVLQMQTLLLVLDNCEHLVDAVAALAEAIVTHAPGVRLLATSQELLNVPDEKLIKLRPLAVPAGDEMSANPEQFGAIRLFAERAQAADPRFALGPANANAIADICRRLDGLPLAIELAAARVGVLGVQGVRDRLGERFRVLTGGARTAMRRHQTLRGAIDWSHALLSTDEQTVFRRLGVFVGGFTLELAQQVASDAKLDEWSVLEALSALVDKSLVAADASEPPRYQLLETTRAYALEKLADAGETGMWIGRHAHAIHDLFAQTEEGRFGEQGTLSMAAFMQRLTPELDNARTALDWAMGEAGDLAIAIWLAGASAEVFRRVGLSQEALRRMLTLQPRVDGSVDPQCAALFWLGLSSVGSWQLPGAALVQVADRAMRIYRASGARRRLFRALLEAAFDLTTTHESSAAEAMLHEMLSLEDPSWPVWFRSSRLLMQSHIYFEQGRFEEQLATLLEMQATLSGVSGEKQSLLTCELNLCYALNMLKRHEEALTLARSLLAGQPGVHGTNTYALYYLMQAQLSLGRIDDAALTMRHALPGWRRDGFVLHASSLLAVLLGEQGRMADAARVDGVATAYRRRRKVEHDAGLAPLSAQLQQLFDGASLKPEDIERCQREGELLDEAAIVAICLRDGNAASAPTTR
jgi:predicted ATPase/DNA-binding winged helix-turn-helix (wHTH) protein